MLQILQIVSVQQMQPFCSNQIIWNWWQYKMYSWSHGSIHQYDWPLGQVQIKLNSFVVKHIGCIHHICLWSVVSYGASWDGTDGIVGHVTSCDVMRVAGLISAAVEWSGHHNSLSATTDTDSHCNKSWCV